jgi:hypothetical protein
MEDVYWRTREKVGKLIEKMPLDQKNKSQKEAIKTSQQLLVF